MRRNGFGVVLTVAALTIALFGCPLRSKDDAAPADAGTITVTGTGVKNEAQVTRYPNETALGSIPALILKDGTVARTFPGAGVQVAVLPKSTPCGKVAQYGNAGTLIMWNEPDGSALMGWVPNASFQGGLVPSTVKPVVVAKDAAAPVVHDAGGTAPPATQDAGAPNFGTCTVSCPAINNQCPTGKKNDGGMCRIPCKSTADCPRAVTCSAKGMCTSG